MSGFPKPALALLLILILVVLCLILKLVHLLWRHPRFHRCCSVEDTGLLFKERILFCLFRKNQSRVEPNPSEARAAPPSKPSAVEEVMAQAAAKAAPPSKPPAAEEGMNAADEYDLEKYHATRVLYTIEEVEVEEEESAEASRRHSDGGATVFYTPTTSPEQEEVMRGRG